MKKSEKQKAMPLDVSALIFFCLCLKSWYFVLILYVKAEFLKINVF